MIRIDDRSALDEEEPHRRARVGGDALSKGIIAQTLDRGLQVLQYLSMAGDGLTINELAEELEVHRTIIYRLLNTLALHRLVTHGRNGRYYLGSGILALAQRFNNDLRSIAYPELELMAEEMKMTACLTVAEGVEGVAVLSVEPRNSAIHVVYRVGFRHPLYVGANGIAILAGRVRQPDERSEVSKARQQGYAVSCGEIQNGAIGLAAPIIVGDDPAEASVGVITLGQFEEEVLASRVCLAARRIAQALG